MRGPYGAFTSGTRLGALALAMACVLVTACSAPAAAGGTTEAQFITRTVQLDKVGEVEGQCMHVLNVECERGWEIRYSWRAEIPVRFAIVNPSGQYVRVLETGPSSYSVYTVRSEGQYTLRWVNPSTSRGTDLAYTVKAVPANVLGEGTGLDDGDTGAYSVDDVAIICIAGILASAFSIFMMLGALYVRATPWRRSGASVERQCLEMYSQAYGVGARPPEGPTYGTPRR